MAESRSHLVLPEAYLSRFRSKQDLYKYLRDYRKERTLTLLEQYYLPPKDSITMLYLRAILGGEKKIMPATMVKHQQVPYYEELSVKKWYPWAMEQPDVKAYLPDLETHTRKLPPRDFFFAVLGTVRHDYLKAKIQEAQKSRLEASDTKAETQYIKLTEEWKNKLEAVPYISSKFASLLIISEKKGTGVFLLRQGYQGRKKRQEKDRRAEDQSDGFLASDHLMEEMKEPPGKLIPSIFQEPLNFSVTTQSTAHFADQSVRHS